MNKKRELNIDLLKTIAVLCVISVHFMLHSGFYSTPIQGNVMYAALAMRTFFVICVPLFMLATGYLMNKKQLTLQYYKGIVGVLLTFLLIALCYTAYEKITSPETSYLTFLKGCLIFKNHYSWYIEMYIGLFLMIPFLNLIYHNLNTQRQKLVLVATFFFLTSFSGTFNLIENVLPDWWTAIYPLTYYFIGAYVKEYSIKIKSIFLFLIMLFILIGNTTVNYFYFDKKIFQWDALTAYGGFETVLLATALFLFIKRLNLTAVPRFLRFIITKISELSLSIYLSSWIFDQIFYPILSKKIPDFSHRLSYYPVMVLLVLCSSILLSLVIHGIVSRLTVKLFV